VIKAKDR